jgi:hypothetical protein
MSRLTCSFSVAASTISGLFVLGHDAVDLARGDDEARHRIPAQPLAELIRCLEVRAENVGAQGPRGGDHRCPGQVEHTVGARGPQHLSRSTGLRQVAVHRGHVLLNPSEVVGGGTGQNGPHHLRTFAQGELGEMAPGEAGDTRDQDLHGTPA